MLKNACKCNQKLHTNVMIFVRKCNGNVRKPNALIYLFLINFNYKVATSCSCIKLQEKYKKSVFLFKEK